jgi:hypothetical protein
MGSKDQEESEAEVEEEEEESGGEFVTEQQRQCPSGRYWQGTGLCGCSFASNYGWTRGVWVRGDGTGASRPGAVTPRLARTPAETPGGWGHPPPPPPPPWPLVAFLAFGILLGSWVVIRFVDVGCSHQHHGCRPRV